MPFNAISRRSHKASAELVKQYSEILHQARAHPYFTYVELESMRKVPKDRRPLFKLLKDVPAKEAGLKVYARQNVDSDFLDLLTFEHLSDILHGLDLHPGYQYSMINANLTGGNENFCYPEGEGWLFRPFYHVPKDAEHGGPVLVSDNHLTIRLYRLTPEGEQDGAVDGKPIRRMSYAAHMGRPHRHPRKVSLSLLQAMMATGTMQYAVKLPPHNEVYVVCGDSKRTETHWTLSTLQATFNLYSFKAPKVDVGQSLDTAIQSGATADENGGIVETMFKSINK
jgi:hypothetical protein